MSASTSDIQNAVQKRSTRDLIRVANATLLCISKRTTVNGTRMPHEITVAVATGTMLGEPNSPVKTGTPGKATDGNITRFACIAASPNE
jgi:hypothetical protein